MNINLNEYGFTDYFSAQIDGDSALLPARVTRVNRGAYEVLCENGIKNAKLRGTYYTAEDATMAFPTAGDFVLINSDTTGDAIIHKTLIRKSFFSRNAPGSKGEQAIAANFDHVFIVMALNENYNLSRLERYLAQSWQSGAVPVVILTKSDLCADVDLKLAAAEKTALGAQVIAASCVTGEGIDDVSRLLKPGGTVVLLGSSGAGKSTLINTIAGSEVMATGAVRESDGEGRHTTTHRQLIMLNSGSMVIDTPGMRALSLINAEDGFDETFSDIDNLAAQCRFSDCKHRSEPGCAVRRAVDDGLLDERRLKNYFQLKRQAMYHDDRTSYQKLMRERLKSLKRK